MARRSLALALTSALAGLATGCGEGPRPAPVSGPTAAESGVAGSDRGDARPMEPEPGPGEPRFIARRELDVAGSPAGLAIADLDGDGRPDLAVAYERPGGLAVWTSRRGGLAGPPVRLAGAGWMLGPTLFVDGERPALAAASRESSALHGVRLVDGVAAESRVVLDGSPRAIGAGPLAPGADGSVVVVTDDGRLVRWRPGAPPASVRIPPVRATDVAVAADGGSVWIASQRPRALLRFASADLAGERAEPTAQLALDGIPRALVESDVDGDGDPELVCYGGDEELWILGLGRPGGAAGWTDGEPRRFRAPGLVPLAAASVDLDGDGRAELVSVQAYDTSYGVLGGYDPGLDRFRLRASEYAGQTPVDLAVGDLDGDGRPDLAIANLDARRVSVLPGTGLARAEKPVFHEARRSPVGTNPLGVAVGDLDGDGAPDAVSANGSAASLTVLFSRYGLLEQRRDLAVGPSPTAVRVTDVDADGRADLVALVRPPGGAQLVLRRGLGGGEFAEPEAIELGGDAARLERVDLAGDGAPDLVACDPLGGRVLVLDLPLGPEPPAVRALDLGPSPTAVAGLLGPDGRELLAVAHGGPAAALSLHRVEAGAAVELARAPAEGLPVDLAAGTFPGDDVRLALLARRGAGDPVGHLELWRVRPGLLVPATRFEVGLAASEVVAGDLDRDGRDDLLVSAQNTHNVNLFLGAGDELARRPDLGAGLGCLGLALGDLDGNGWLDVVVANAFSHDLSAIYALPSR